MKQLNMFKRLYYTLKIKLYNFFSHRNNNESDKLCELYNKEKDLYLTLDTKSTQQEPGLSLDQIRYCIEQRHKKTLK